jgi:UPF0288 family protein (methanogenesis marker protein 3)
MGWVKQRIADADAYKTLTLPLWNSLRDAVGAAVTEFNDHASIVPDDRLRRSDCQSQARYCIRVTRGNRSIELFLNESDRSVQISELPNPARTVAQFKLNRERDELDLSTSTVDGQWEEATADTVCEMALSDLLFTPPPRRFNAQD